MLILILFIFRLSLCLSIHVLRAYVFSVFKLSYCYRPQYLSSVSVFSSQNPRHSTPESPESRASQIWFFVKNFCLAVPSPAAPPWPPPPRAAPECVTWCFPADFYVVPKRPWNYLRYGTFPFWAQLIFFDLLQTRGAESWLPSQSHLVTSLPGFTQLTLHLTRW